MSLSSVHETLAWVAIFGSAAVGLWATAAHWREPLRHRALWPTTYVVWAVLSVQIIVGVIRLQNEGVEVAGIHTFYGFLCLASVTIIYSYRPQVEQWQYLLFGLGNLFIMGLALRAAL